MAGEASLELCFGARSSVFIEVTEPPASGRGILFRVLDHKLNVRGRPGHERLGIAKDFVVFRRRDVT